MAVDMFIKIPGGDGEATDSKHEGWIEVLQFSHSVLQPTTVFSRSPDRAPRRADFEDLSVTKFIDKASPKLMLKCATGDHIPEVQFDVRRTIGGQQETYLAYEFTECILSSFSAASAEAGSDVPSDDPAAGGGVEDKALETVTLNFAKISMKYTPFDDDTGTAGASVEAAFDIAAARKRRRKPKKK